MSFNEFQMLVKLGLNEKLKCVCYGMYNIMLVHGP